VNHCFHSVKSPRESLGIPDISDEPTKTRVVPEFSTNLVLLQLVAREHCDSGRFEILECVADEGLPE
jgi:hypothetical protein